MQNDFRIQEMEFENNVQCCTGVVCIVYVCICMGPNTVYTCTGQFQVYLYVIDRFADWWCGDMHTGTSGKPSHPDGFRIIGRVIYTIVPYKCDSLMALRQNVRQARKNADTPARLFRFYLDRLKPIS
jgi:hypothetical protein